MAEWHLITCEYPPQAGGVSDYTQLVARGLAAAGDDVHVWCPSQQQRSEIRNQRSEAADGQEATVVVHRDFGRFTPADLRRVDRLLDQFNTPRRLLVQWVPHGYGYRSMNLGFCLWLRKRVRLKHDRLEIMVHEPFLTFGEGSTKQDVAAAVHRLMVVILLRAASRVWVSIPDWKEQLRPFAIGKDKSFGWLPVPSNIAVVDDPEGFNKVRAQYSRFNESLVGHFGAYDSYMSKLMLQLLPVLLEGPGKPSVILLGKGSRELRTAIIEQHPDLSLHVHASGTLAVEEISRHISACDVMLQPYQDGVSGRRTSVMTALSHGIPVVTTIGKATEKCWLESQAVKLTAVGDISAMVDVAKKLLADAPERCRLSEAGRALYEARFDLKQTIARLRNDETQLQAGALTP
jgi:glycosyltransferase involved in cell wall biosynthesis